MRRGASPAPALVNAPVKTTEGTLYVTIPPDCILPLTSHLQDVVYRLVAGQVQLDLRRQLPGLECAL
jgi:hypothetical protein